MKPIETLLRNLAETEIQADPAFKTQLRRDLILAASGRGARSRGQGALTFALLGTLFLIGAFVARPDLAGRVHGWLMPEESRQAAYFDEPISRRPVEAPAVEPGRPKPHLPEAVPKVRKVVSETFYVLRHVELANGERAVLLSEVSDPPAVRYRMY